MLTDAQILLFGREAGLLFTRKENIIFARAIEAAVIEAGASGAAQDAAWQPIETASRRGEWLLVHGRTSMTSAGMMVVRWDGRDWESADDGYGAYITPTHWMPLPKPPAAIDEAVEAQQRGSGT